MKRVLEYEIVDHGIEHSDYFQGCGVALTKFTDVATGTGQSLREALENAAEDLASRGYEIPRELDAEIDAADGAIPSELSHTNCGDDECYAADVDYHASIRVRAAEE